MLNQSQKDQYSQNGYLVLNELFSSEQMNLLKSAAMQIVEDFDPMSTRSIFSTEHADTNRDDYFLSSGKINPLASIRLVMLYIA
jgi:phytanoyl-CoA hydroxylase